MCLLRKSYLFVFSAALLVAQDASWQTKPLAQWDEADARQVLTSVSPWAKVVPATILNPPNETLLRGAGRMGGGQGVGTEALTPTSLFGGKRRSPEEQPNSLGDMVIRWESASPIRAAEVKLGGGGAPRWSGDYYAIAVYNVPTTAAGFNARSAGRDLQKLGVLRRPGKKDLKPTRIDILPVNNELSNVLYLFPRSQPITDDDTSVELLVHLGRIYVTQWFDPAEMKFEGKPEL